VSLLPPGLSLALAAAEGLLSPVIFRQRNIGGIVADVTTSEHHEDETVITDHPVEQGANVSDHAYNVQAKLNIQVGFSNSSSQSGGDPNYVDDIYQQFLAMKGNRQPIEVLTGKRSYTNMLIARLSTTTDEKTENYLGLTVELREVILVDTQVVSVPNASVMANPQSNAAPLNNGTQQVQPAPNFNDSAATGL
jgi:Dit-like tail protein